MKIKNLKTMKISIFTKEQDNDIRELVLEKMNNQEIYELVESKIPLSKVQIVNRIAYTRALLKKEIGFDFVPTKLPTIKPISHIDTAQKVVYEGVVKNETDEAKKLRLSKTQLIFIEKSIPDLKYPIVARYIKTDSNHIALFTSLHRCVIIVPGESGLAAGHVSETLGACNDISHWEIVNSATVKFKSF